MWTLHRRGDAWPVGRSVAFPVGGIGSFAVATQSELSSYDTALPRAADDQNLAGGILWGSGDLIGLLIFSVLFVQRVRSSMRDAVREDRRLDRLDRLERAGGG